MHKFFSFPLLLFFISCSPFGENNVLKHKTELKELVSKIDKYEHGTYDRDEIDEFTINDVRALNIDIIVKNQGKTNSSFSGFTEEEDSLIIFINRSNNFFDTEKRIIYDFNKTPRNYGTEKITNASYKITQVDDRWYYSEVGFD